MEWAFAAVVGVVSFLLGYAVRAMQGRERDPFQVRAPSRSSGRVSSTTPVLPRSQPLNPPPELPADALSEVEELLLRDKKIEAIKAYREATGLGLKESKDAVEAIQRRLLNPANSP